MWVRFDQWANLGKLQEVVKDREAWDVADHGVVKSWTRPSDWTTAARWLKWAFSQGSLEKQNQWDIRTVSEGMAVVECVHLGSSPALEWCGKDLVCLSVSRTPFICPLALPVGFLPGLGASLSSSGLGIPARRTSVVQLSSQSPEPESPPSAASPVFTLNDWDVGKGHLSWVTHSVGMAQTSSPTDPRVKGWVGGWSPRGNHPSVLLLKRGYFLVATRWIRGLASCPASFPALSCLYHKVASQL